MFLFIVIFLGLSSILLLVTGIWILFIAQQVKITSTLISYIFLGSFIAALSRITKEPNEYVLKDWVKNILGAIFIISALIAVYAIAILFNTRLI